MAQTNKAVYPLSAIYYQLDLSWCEGDEHGAPLTIRTPKLSISFLSLPISLPEQWDRMCLHISNGLSDDNFCGFTVADGFVWLPDKDRPETVVLCVLAEVIAGVSVYGSIQQPYRVYWAIFQFHIREHTVLFLYCSSTTRWKIEKKKKYEFVAAEHRALADFGIRESEVFSVSCGFSSVAILSWNKRSLRDAAGCCFVQPLFIWPPTDEH